jgi:hypothetical protein
MNRGTVEDANFYSDEETADVGLDIDENLLREEDLEVFNTNSEFDQQSNADLDAESMDDEHTLPPSVRLQSPSPVQPGTTHTPLVSAITDNVELVHDGSDTSDTAPCPVKLHILVDRMNRQSTNQSFLQPFRQNHLWKLGSDVYESLVPCI